MSEQKGMAAFNFFKKKSVLKYVPENEIRVFYQMLLKMKKRHPKLNAKKIIKKLYPYYTI